MSEQYEKISDGAKNALDKFSSNKYVKGTSEFLNSNSIVAKFAFLLLVIVIFVLLLRLGAAIIDWFMKPDPNPILLDGTLEGNNMMVFPQDPKKTGSVPILRSVNDATGVEFTWSIWIYLKSSNFSKSGDAPEKYKHIFHKGNNNFHSSDLGLSTYNNCPGLYLDSNKNTLLILMNTFKSPTLPNAKTGAAEPESVEIDDIPINKWVNVIIRVSKQNQVDIYINGTLMKREILDGVVKQNYDDVYLSSHKGFHGYSSSLRYFNHAIGTNRIQEIVDNGPNLKMLHGSSERDAVPRYLSTRWFFSDTGNLYNPSTPT